MLAIALGFAACTAVGERIGGARLFPRETGLERFDFEEDAIGAVPDGFEAVSGAWAVADSPSAVSGRQLIALKSDSSAALALKEEDAAREVRGEVGVRVFLGTSGAGLACRSQGGESYVAKVEPEAARVALYRQSGEAGDLLGKHEMPIAKGAWTRVGIVCRSNSVAAFIDGKPVVEAKADLSAPSLALHADGGTTVQFDDLAVTERN